MTEDWLIVLAAVAGILAFGVMTVIWLRMAGTWAIRGGKDEMEDGDDVR